MYCKVDFKFIICDVLLALLRKSSMGIIGFYLVPRPGFEPGFPASLLRGVTGSRGTRIYITPLHDRYPSHAISNDRNHLPQSMTEIIDCIYIAPAQLCTGIELTMEPATIYTTSITTVYTQRGFCFLPVSMLNQVNR